ncbi:MAG: ribonuclease R family protein [Acidobacteriaceae bacterium]
MAQPGNYRYSDNELLRRIGRSPNGRAGYKQLVRELGMGGGRERRLLLEQLARMTARGDLAKIDRETWTIPKPKEASGTRGARGGRGATRENLAAGRLDLHRDGYGFVRPEAKQEWVPAGGDIFISPSDLGGAMQGDQVLVELAPLDREGRLSGRIVRILNRRNPTMVGIFHYGGGNAMRRSRAGAQGRGLQGRGSQGYAQSYVAIEGNYVTPLDERMTQPILIPDGCEIPLIGTRTPDRVLGAEALAQMTPKGRGQGTGSSEQAPAWDDLEGLAVDVEVTEFPTVSKPARGRILEILGDQNAFGVDVEIVIRKHHLPHRFPENVLADAREEARETVATLSAEELAERRDFRGLPIVTIDGETARDFDDAVYAISLPNGNMQLQVHIADVSNYVREGTALDLEARLRGTSVYFPDRAIPMLPQELSTDICSLRPDEDRLVLSCLMEIDPQGEVLGYEVCEGIIRSARRMTYTQVQSIIEPVGAEDEAVRTLHLDLLPEFDRMYALSKMLHQKRVRRGSIDFDLPEPVIQFDDLGAMQGVVRSERKWANRLIEEFMLAANECVATWIEQQAIPSIYRIHEKPEPKKVLEFEETAAAFGYSLGFASLPVKKFAMKSDRRDQQRRGERGGSGGRRPREHEVVEDIPVTPRMYQKLTDKVAGKPEERILSYLMLRSLRQARYSEQNEGHFALAAPCYTHFTSPIRRYPDLIVHRIVKDLLHAGANPLGAAILNAGPNPWSGPGASTRARSERPGIPRLASETWDTSARSSNPGAPSFAVLSQRVGSQDLLGPIPTPELAAIAQETSVTERRAADAERELIEWKKIKFMQDRVGEDFDALILSATKYGLFVELDGLFVEGLVPLSSLTDDYYTYRENARQVCGQRNGRCYSMGQRVRVLLDRIDKLQRRLQFAIIPEAPGIQEAPAAGAPAAGEYKKFKRQKSTAAAKKKTGKAAAKGKKKRR